MSFATMRLILLGHATRLSTAGYSCLERRRQAIKSSSKRPQPVVVPESPGRHLPAIVRFCGSEVTGKYRYLPACDAYGHNQCLKKPVYMGGWLSISDCGS